MILRSLTKHVKDQNWFAVALDFVIVVIGVGVALMAQQWISDRQQRADLSKAEYVLASDIFRILYNSEERLSLTQCRRQRTRELIQLLQAPGEAWAGTTQDMENWYSTEFDPVTTTAARAWGSGFWDAELQRGTFNNMDDERRYRLGSVFQYAGVFDEYANRVYDLEARFNVLSLPMTLLPSERSHYLELLAQHDGLTSFQDLGAIQMIEQIKTIDVDRSHPDWTEIREWLIDFNTKGPIRWGECFVPITSELLDIKAPEEPTP